MDFKQLKAEDLPALHDFFASQNTRKSPYSAAYQFMWGRDSYRPDYAIIGQCLVLKVNFYGRTFFYYPMSLTGNPEEENAALTEIETYCRRNYTALHYINVPGDRLPVLLRRYPSGVRVESDRKWSEYLYDAAAFRSFEGRKFSGQRNHVNKFYRLFPSAEFKIFRAGDEKKIENFLVEFETVEFTKKNDRMAKRELDAVKELINYFTRLSLVCGYMEIDGKVVSVAVGEVCGDTLMEHVEKALRAYEGIYPATAQAFARAFASDGVRYINREDDAGDLGLRKSKMQYNPSLLLPNYRVTVDKLLQKVHTMPVIKGENVTLKRIPDEDGEIYRELAADVERNRYWGYDYRTALPDGRVADGGYFLSLIRRDFKERNEMALGIYLDGALIGEAVVHNCGYAGEAEVGARVLPAYEGRGFACEAIRILTEFCFSELGAETVQAKCYKQNARSKRMLERAGMRLRGEDDVFYYFHRTPAM